MSHFVVAFAIPVAVLAYAYLGYPLLLMLLAEGRSGRQEPPADPDWPSVSLVVVAHNEEASIGALLESVLSLDYPAGKVQVVVVSDSSTDRTDTIVEEFSRFGVSLLRLCNRVGKTAGENAALPLLTGEIVVNTDATIRFTPGALKALVRAFGAPDVGVASGCDISVPSRTGSGNTSESLYVSYEMWVRDLETSAGGIVGASGCFFAVRRERHTVEYPSDCFRDFAACLTARLRGFRSVSVLDAICFVPRTVTLRAEYRRKVRTIARGMRTIAAHRQLLNPLAHGRFAIKLISHKLCRWVLPWSLVACCAVVGAADLPWAAVRLDILGGIAAVAFLLLIGEPRTRRAVRLLLEGLAANAAVLHATVMALFGDVGGPWAPTRRP